MNMLAHRPRVFPRLTLIGLVLMSACGEFETPSIVLDLRVLAISAQPPEVVIPVQLENLEEQLGDPATVAEIVESLPDVQVCALVADPAENRSLEFEMHACAPTDELRCDEPGKTVIPLGSGTIEDPEQASAPVSICSEITPSLALFSVLQESFEQDVLAGFSGLTVQVQLSVRAEGAPAEDGIFAVKRVIYSLDFPVGKVANQNPGLSALARETAGSEEITLPLGRCGDISPHVIGPDNGLVVIPQEADDAREVYVLPTFDGGVRTFTENLTYRWYATDGSFSADATGGPRDIAGNQPPLDTEWTAPADIDEPLDVSLWVVQRDERGGLGWYETCIRVE